jgi:ABC-type phosphate/phosphonate transport system substrate-binding protein
MQDYSFKLPAWLFALVALIAGVSSATAEEYVFTAPPRDNEENETKIYKPIADALSQATGKKIVYRFPGDWLSYQSQMRKGAYDIVFDGPHFLSWRMRVLGHEPVAKLPGRLAFVVITRKDNDKYQELKDLSGRSLCALAPPNLATLAVLAQFDNPARLPYLAEVESFEAAYREAMQGKRCVAAVLRDKLFEKLDKGEAKVLWRSRGLANQGFSVGPRLGSQDKQKIAEVLLAPDAKTRFTAFFDAFNKGKDLERATPEDYEGLYVLLKDVYGYAVEDGKAR